MKEFDVIALGNAIVDLQLQISEEEFSALKLEKAAMKLVEVSEQEGLLKKLAIHSINQASGGSAANTVIAVSQLGAKAAYNCVVGNDPLGKFYVEEMQKLGVSVKSHQVNSSTGTCVILITPDAERTMNTHLGASAFIDENFVSEEQIAKAKWLYIEGYLFSSESGQRAVKKGLEYAKKHDVKVAVTLSDGFIVEFFSKPLREALKSAELVFANQNEASKYTGLSDPEEIFKAYSKQFPISVMTMSEKGAKVSFNGKELFIKPYRANAIDDTGAGDIFAGAFLYGLSSNLGIEETGKLSCYLASKVVSQLGPRLKVDLKEVISKKEYLIN